MKIMKRFLVIILGCLQVSFSHAQWFSGEYTTEVQWDLKKHTNWLNHLRLDLAIPLWEGKGTLEAATLHVARTREGIIDDWQGHSNIEEDNMLAALAVLGYMHEWKEAHLFVGVRNVNEDFFTSDVTSLFTNGSCGIFPTIAASYPIANFPLSGLTVYFDVGKDGWVLRNSLYNGVGYNGWKHHDNPFRLRPKTDGIFNISSWSIPIPRAATMRAWPFTRASLPSTRRASRCQPRRLPPRLPAPGGSMANRHYGPMASIDGRKWHNTRRTQATTTAATATQR